MISSLHKYATFIGRALESYLDNTKIFKILNPPKFWDLEGGYIVVWHKNIRLGWNKTRNRVEAPRMYEYGRSKYKHTSSLENLPKRRNWGRGTVLSWYKKAGRVARNSYGRTRCITPDQYDKSVPGNVAGTIFQTSKLAQYKLSNTVVEFAVLYV